MLFFRKSVDSLIRDIVNKIEQLHAVAEAHHVASEIHDAVAAEKAKLAAALRTERDRAKAIAEKLTHLVSV